MLDVNKHLFLRNIASIEVEHVDGNTEKISLPDDIGLTMWTNGIMEPFIPRFSAVLDSIIPYSPASESNLQKGDVILSVNGKDLDYWDEFTNAIQSNDRKQEISIVVLRDAVKDTIHITPDAEGKIGVYPKGLSEDDINIQHKSYSFGESLSKGTSTAYWTLRDYMAQFEYVFTKKGATSLGGFGTILSIFPTQWDWQRFWSLTAFLSIMLAFMNLLPIPALDGGHVVFTLYEMVTGRKPSDKFLEYAQITGFILLMGLLLFANGNDVYKWITGKF